MHLKTLLNLFLLTTLIHAGEVELYGEKFYSKYADDSLTKFKAINDTDDSATKSDAIRRLQTTLQKNLIDSVTAYEYFWAGMIDKWTKSQDAEFKGLILKKWDECLTTSSATHYSVQAAAQIRALREKWCAEFATPAFYELLESSEDEKVLSAISRVLSEYGQPKDKELLKRRYENVKNPIARKKIYAALVWFGRWGEGVENQTMTTVSVRKPNGQ